MKRKFVRVLPSKSGARFAIMARNDGFWVQVEAIIGRENADQYADRLEHDADLRAQVIEQCEDDDWAEDAPVETDREGV